MMQRRITIIIASLGIVVLALWLGPDPSLATTLLFDRGLPINNLNNVAGENRCNVAWAYSSNSPYPASYFLPGDDFVIKGSGEYHLDTIRLWTVSKDCGLVLWGGQANKLLEQLSTTYISTPVTYQNGESYLGTSGCYRDLYQIDFTVDWLVQGGKKYLFFLDGPFTLYNTENPGLGYDNAYLHATAKDSCGSCQEGADNQLLWLLMAEGNPLGVDCNESKEFWNKCTDTNVQVFGSLVPLPSSLLLLSSLLSLAGIRKLLLIIKQN
jgi:hypothetical protein